MEYPLKGRKIQLVLNMPGTGSMIVNGYIIEHSDMEDTGSTIGLEVEVVGLITEKPVMSST